MTAVLKVRGYPRLSEVTSRIASRGLTLIEMLIVLAIVGVVLFIAVPSYNQYIERANVVLAQKDIMMIADEVEDYFLDRHHYPDSLADINLEDMEDPWGNPYEFLRIDGNSTPGLIGKLRKDKNLVPINSDYDLYSMGPDGRSVSPLTASHSRDDIIRANNGGFIGIAENY